MIETYMLYLQSFDSDSQFVIERFMAQTVSFVYEASSTGRGITRLFWVLVGIPTMVVGLFVSCVLLLLQLFVIWLVLPKEEWDELAEEENI